MREWVIAHPRVAADVLVAVSAILAGMTVWRAYRVGIALGALEALRGESARVASEALGG